MYVILKHKCGGVYAYMSINMYIGVVCIHL